jgi:hypothetical protein
MAYAWYGTVTVDHTKCGTADSTDFPVFVSMSDTVLKTVANGGKITSASGYDLAFFSDISLTTALPFEIESYDGTAGTYKAFVKVATLSKTTDTVIYFGYADSAVTSSQENVDNVWSNGFVSVYHFRDGSSLSLLNALSSGPTLTSAGGVAAAAGLVGTSGSADNDGSAGHGLYASTAPLSTYPITLEAWVNVDALANGKYFVGVGAAPPSGTSDAHIELRSNGAVRLFNGGQFVTTTATFSTGSTHYVVGTASSEDNRTIYLDGGNAVTNNTTHTASQGTWNKVDVSSDYTSTNWTFNLNGRVDEVRISNVVRDASWILSTYNNLNSVATFTTNVYGNSTVAGNSGDIAAASSYSGSVYWNGTNRMLSIDVLALSGTRTVSAVTYGGAACTLVGALSKNAMRVESWRIHSNDSGAPASGLNTLAVTLSGSAEFVVAWVNRTGVHATTHTEAFNSASGTNAGVGNNASLTVTSVTNNATIHAACVADDTSITAGQTTRNNVVGTLGSGANEDPGAVTTPAGAVSMTYTGLGTTASWAMTGYSIRPDTANASGGGRFNYEFPTLSL